MKTEFADVCETKKTLTIEIPSTVVDAEIARVARDYTKQARIPGFRPGKVPAQLVKQRFREQILHDVMHDLIPKAVQEALHERGIEPIDRPDIKDVAMQEGQPLKFTAAIETVPPFDPGDLSSISLRRHAPVVEEGSVDQALERMRERAAKYETVEGRPAQDGDSVVLDLRRTEAGGGASTHDDVTIEIGASGNPPGFDGHLVGLSAGEEKTFQVRFPEDYPVSEMAGSEVTYHVRVKDVRRRLLPELDDELAKDLGQFETLAELKERIRSDLQVQAELTAQRELRNDLLKELARRLGFEAPTSLVERELDKRLEEFAHRLIDRRIDPRKAGVDWAQLRESQRETAGEAVASALVLEEVARRESITVAVEDVDKEIERFAQRSGRTPAAVRAELEKEGGMTRLHASLRRERTVDFVLSRVKMVDT
jgi:trigger factor